MGSSHCDLFCQQNLLPHSVLETGVTSQSDGYRVTTAVVMHGVEEPVGNAGEVLSQMEQDTIDKFA